MCRRPQAASKPQICTAMNRVLGHRLYYRNDLALEPGNRLGTEMSKANLHGPDSGNRQARIKRGAMNGPEPQASPGFRGLAVCLWKRHLKANILHIYFMPML